jgi:hypothetical protein
MTAQSFAAFTRHEPTRPNGALHGYTCHAAALHWAFRELGDNEADAGAKLQLILGSKCALCQGGPNMGLHASLPHGWYGAQLCGTAVLVPDRAAMRANVVVGDVVLAGVPQYPMHSMVVVGKTSFLAWDWTYIRGFNNVGSLGTGPHNAYDADDRDIDKERYWHTVLATTYFGTSAANQNQLYRITYANFIAAAQVVNNNCNLALGTYTGP